MSESVPPPLARPTPEVDKQDIRLFGYHAELTAKEARDGAQSNQGTNVRTQCGGQLKEREHRETDYVQPSSSKRLGEWCEYQRAKSHHDDETGGRGDDLLLVGVQVFGDLGDARCEHGTGQRTEDSHQGDDRDIGDLPPASPASGVLLLVLCELDLNSLLGDMLVSVWVQ